MAVFAQACLREFEPNTKLKIWCADIFNKRELKWKQAVPLKILAIMLSVMPRSWAHQIINTIIMQEGFSSGLVSDNDFKTSIRYIKSMPWTGSYASDRKNSWKTVCSRPKTPHTMPV